MINNSTVIGIIPARGGSKGIFRKNLVNISGKPLINWTISEAKKLNLLDELILSSDDEEIMSCAKVAGCNVPFKRPAHLATDEASTIDVVFHALSEFPDYDYVILLQPTSPLRKGQDIENAINLMVKKNAPACLSVSSIKMKPDWMFYVDKDKKLDKVIKNNEFKSRRQELRETFVPNGAIYIADTAWLKRNRSFYSDETVGYVMPEDVSVDIDDISDIKDCEMVL